MFSLLKLSLLYFVFLCCFLPIGLESLVTSDTSDTLIWVVLTFLFISCRHRLSAVLGGNGWKSIGVREEEEIKSSSCLLASQIHQVVLPDSELPYKKLGGCIIVYIEP